MSDPTPGTPQCNLQRATGATVETFPPGTAFDNWPGNIEFKPPLYFKPKTRSELANAILKAESAGHHVRAHGATWSFSDAVRATTGSPTKYGAMIDTLALNASLQSELPHIMKAGVDSTFLYHVEAGVTCTKLNEMLDQRWTGWSKVAPNQISSDPAAVSWGPNRIDVFARGTDSQMYTISWDGTQWTGWSSLGGEFTSGPAVASWGPNRLDVFGRGLDNALWTNSWTGSSWTGWHQVAPEPISSDPVAVSWGPNRIDVFARGTDNQMYTISWDGTQWTGWSSLGGEFTSGPAVASWGPNRLDVFGRGTNGNPFNNLYTNSWTGSSWTGWHEILQIAPQEMYSDPIAVSQSFNQIDVFARGHDDQMYKISWDGTQWLGWFVLGGEFTSGPGAASWAPDRLDIFGRGKDNALWTRSRTGQALEAGGGSGQTLAGLISTSTHSGDSLVTPLVDYVRAFHLVGAGGIEHWIERDSGITDPAKLQTAYPCLARGNIHYNTKLFNAVLVSAGSMGVIYSLIIKTVPQCGLLQHRVATTWEDLLVADPTLAKVIDGSYLAGRNLVPPNPAEVDILDAPIVMNGDFSPNSFSQIVINPYPLYANDASLTTQEALRVGHHLCFVTNRVEQIPVPRTSHNPRPPDTIESMGNDMAKAAVAALAPPGSPVYLIEGLKFENFGKGLDQQGKNVSEKAAALVDFLAEHYNPGTISALIHFVLKKILPIGDRFDVSHKLSEVIVWDDKIKSFCVEAAFNVPDALAFVPKVLKLVDDYAARTPRPIYIGGYLALRFVGKKTDALLGMQQWSPTCCVEYLGVAGSVGFEGFVDDLQKLALASKGILHFGLQNNVMTAADVRNAYGSANVEAFRRARGTLSQHGTLATFDNTFTDRLGLSALKGLVFSGNSSDVIMHTWDPGAFFGQPGGYLVEGHARPTEVIHLYNHSDHAVQVKDVRITSSKDVPGALVFKVTSPRPFLVGAQQFSMIDVTYTGTGPGLLTGTVEVDCDDPIEPTLRMSLATTVKPLGKHALLQLAPISLDFGTRVISTTQPKFIDVTNVGSYDALIDNLSLTLEQPAGQFQSPSYVLPGGRPLTPGQSERIYVSYSPTMRGTANATMVMNMRSRSDTGVDYLQHVEVPLAGTAHMPTIFLAGVPQRWLRRPGQPPVAVHTRELQTLDFGTAAPSKTSNASFWIRNLGDAPLTVQGMGMRSNHQGAFGVTGTFPLIVQPGGEKEVSCYFVAPSVPGVTAGGEFSVESDDPLRSSALLRMKGRVAGPHLADTSELLDLGTVPPSPASATITFRSDGTEPVVLMKVELASGSDFSVSGVPQLPAQLAPGTELTLTVTLTATLPGHYIGDRLVLLHDGNPARKSQVDLRGTVA